MKDQGQPKLFTQYSIEKKREREVLCFYYYWNYIFSLLLFYLLIKK